MSTLAGSPRRWWALSALVASVLLITLDGTIINIALPVLSDKIGATSSQLQWIGGGYLLVFGAGMLPVGQLGDRYGHKKLLVSGVALFGAGSVAGLFAHSPGAVIAVRCLLGLGAAMIMPLSMAMLPRIFPKNELQNAIGVWTAAAGIGLPLGPIVGGYLLRHFWWGSMFAFNLPVAVIALVAGVMFLPGDSTMNPAERPGSLPFDAIGAVLGIVGIVGLVYGSIEQPEHGWGSGVVIGSLAAGVALVVAFVLRQRSFAHPLVDIGLFGDRRFRWGSLTTVIVNFSLMGMLFVVPQYLEAVAGDSTFGAGLRLLPIIIGLMAAATFSEQLVPRFGVKLVIPAGLALLGAGMLVGTRVDASSGYGLTAAWLAVAGIGFGFAVVPATGMALAQLPENNAGAGSSLLETMQQVGSAFGPALLGSVLAAGYLARLDTTGLPAQVRHAARDSVTGADAVAQATHDQALLTSAHEAFVHGMSLVLTVGGLVALSAAVLTAIVLPRRPDDSAVTQAGSAAAEPATEPEVQQA